MNRLSKCACILRGIVTDSRRHKNHFNKNSLLRIFSILHFNSIGVFRILGLKISGKDPKILRPKKLAGPCQFAKIKGLLLTGYTLVQGRNPYTKLSHRISLLALVIFSLIRLGVKFDTLKRSRKKSLQWQQTREAVRQGSRA